MGIPVHPLSVGVTVTVLTIFESVMLAGAVHKGIFPDPLVARPIVVFELVHANEAPVGLLAKLPILMGAPEHAVMLVI